MQCVSKRIPFYRLLFIGPPGVGKGTYCGRIAMELNCCAISSGNLLRKEVDKGTKEGAAIKSLIDKGEYVPDAIVASLVHQEILHVFHPLINMHHYNGYILDGYPRSVEQAKMEWEKNEIVIDHVINLRQPYEVILAKLSSRRSCADCGFVYNFTTINVGNIKMAPLLPKVNGVCDKCGSTRPFVRRIDDDPAIITKRLEDYDKIALPLIEFYKEKHILHEFDVLGGVETYLSKLTEFINSIYSFNSEQKQ